jgi:acetyltransferase-like isoleucine patch superfamily enzyme
MNGVIIVQQASIYPPWVLFARDCTIITSFITHTYVQPQPQSHYTQGFSSSWCFGNQLGTQTHKLEHEHEHEHKPPYIGPHMRIAVHTTITR